MKLVVSLALIATLCFGCGGGNEQSSDKAVEALPPRAKAAAAPATTETSENAMPFEVERRSVTQNLAKADVRLEGYASKGELETLALRIRQDSFASSNRVFIAFYLPDMKLDAGAWAMAKFDPKLQVDILGPESGSPVAQETITGAKNIEAMGSWVDNRPYVGNTTSIFRESGQLIVETVYQDGSSSRKKLIESATGDGRRFDTVPASRHGDYWVLLPSGKLDVRDTEGSIIVMPRVDDRK